MINKLKICTVLTAVLFVSACGSDDRSNVETPKLPETPDAPDAPDAPDTPDTPDTPACDGNFNLAIQTVAPNYGASSSIALGCSSTATITDSLLIKGDSDYSVSTGSDSFYHIGRSGIDTIAKYQFETSSLQDWEYSTNNADEAGSSNPYKLIEVSNTKAYVIRYGKSNAWIVNPSAKDAASFKIGTLDLSSYLGNGETTVNMSDATIVNGKLFIAMQRIGASYDYTNDSKIAVFDITTDTEIDTTPSDTTDEKGITISGKNVMNLAATSNTLFIASRGDYSNNYGLLEALDTSNFSLKTVISGSDTVGHITHVAPISDERAYILSDLSGRINGIYTYQQNVLDINITTQSTTTELSKYKGTHLSDIEIGPEGNLWIASSVSSNPGVYKINPNTNTELSFIETNLNPIKIVFKK